MSLNSSRWPLCHRPIEGPDADGRRDSGFTLVESAVVLLVLGVLMAFAMPMFASEVTTASGLSCLTGTQSLGLTVMSGQAVCLGTGSTVTGGVHIYGGKVTGTGATVQGGVHVSGAGAFSLTDGTITGGVYSTGASGPSTLCATPSAAASRSSAAPPRSSSGIPGRGAPRTRSPAASASTTTPGERSTPPTRSAAR